MVFSQVLAAILLTAVIVYLIRSSLKSSIKVKNRPEVNKTEFAYSGAPNTFGYTNVKSRTTNVSTASSHNNVSSSSSEMILFFSLVTFLAAIFSSIMGGVAIYSLMAFGSISGTAVESLMDNRVVSFVSLIVFYYSTKFLVEKIIEFMGLESGYSLVVSRFYDYRLTKRLLILAPFVIFYFLLIGIFLSSFSL